MTWVGEVYRTCPQSCSYGTVEGDNCCHWSWTGRNVLRWDEPQTFQWRCQGWKDGIEQYRIQKSIENSLQLWFETLAKATFKPGTFLFRLCCRPSSDLVIAVSLHQIGWRDLLSSTWQQPVQVAGGLQGHRTWPSKMNKVYNYCNSLSLSQYINIYSVYIQSFINIHAIYISFKIIGY